MYYFFLLFCSLLPLFSSAQIRKNVTLLDRWFTDTLLTPSNQMVFNETWGFVHENREYAVIGSTQGTHFFEVTDSHTLRPVDFVQGGFSSTFVMNRDFFDYGGYLYAVGDEGTSSLQIIDLHYLPDSVHLVVDDGINFGRVHTVFIDTSSALLYACTFTPLVNNPSLNFSSLKVFSLANPLIPTEVFGGFDNIPEVHDAYVVNDTAYLNCGFDGLRIYNFANPSNPSLLGTLSVYQDQGYNHSGWLSADRKHLYFTDETAGKRIKKCDVTNIANPTITGIFGTNWQNGSIAHNVMMRDNLLFVSYYNEGLRVFDTRTKPPREVGFYDTYPEDNWFKMNGAWGIYALLPSGRILVSDRKYGLFLLGFDHHVFNVPLLSEEFNVFPNPAFNGESVIFRFNERDVKDIQFYLYDNSGRLIEQREVAFQDYWEWEVQLAAGNYSYRVVYSDFLNRQNQYRGKVVVLN